MYFLVDIIALAFILVLSLIGLKLGFFKSTVDVVLVLVFFAGAGVGAYFLSTYFLEPRFGWITELQKVYVNLLGNSKISGGQAIIETTAYWLSLGSLVLVLFIILSIVLNIVRKLIVKLFDLINRCVILGFIDKLLGFIVNLAVSTALILFVMAVIYCLAQFGILSHSHEVLLSSELLSLVYEVNPFNNLLSPLFQNLTFLTQ